MDTTVRRESPWALPDGLGQAIRGTAEEIAALVRGAGDTALAVPGSQWSVGEAAAHLALANELMADLAAGRERPYGDGTPQSLAAANAQSLAVFTERRAEPLATMIREQAEAFLEAVSRRAGDGAAPATPLGPMNRSVLASYLLTHMLGHGYDLARALKRPHMVDPARAGLCLPFMLAVMPRVADPAATAALTARYRIRLRGGEEFGVCVADGTVRVSPGTPEQRAHCTILLDPVAFLLIALGRLHPWRAIAQGRILAWGPRPWLAPRFPALFTAP
ncbi:maleylpyruvate isomerase family mycothiol-dependent enzyme [Streptomyces sp. 5-8]|uniref:Maleylpyruvate isomerase family mycothiol-dependent enzyme n=1 Tax=Streptomyces musisoli TaxID=2802280 RepID=A0ABS1PE30_9ACTN|nr:MULTISPECIES: maleylpyruvate isomerase family mycothiol-dependent enzyme [Streptomyces]MBL1110638.1 maleylpyruvate isomerase family mycothiol-dependent enzyme [Streptomyces musisoli]MBY8847056.1 maleylpyruvate isomerase family mycothiol-dependent enzyme [Streptomyces sp. SP2-10]